MQDQPNRRVLLKREPGNIASPVQHTVEPVLSSSPERDNQTATGCKSTTDDTDDTLDGFFLTALKNPKDRLFMLKLDKDLEELIRDTT